MLICSISFNLILFECLKNYAIEIRKEKDETRQRVEMSRERNKRYEVNASTKQKKNTAKLHEMSSRIRSLCY